MKSKLLLILLLTSIFISVTATTAQSQDSEIFDSSESSEVHLPILGWYMVPVLGAMRRRRHELNERSYILSTEEPTLN